MEGQWLSRDERVHVSDYRNDRILVFRSDGTSIDQWLSRKISSPDGIAGGANGVVYVGNPKTWIGLALIHNSRET